jgi:hypothetical protein
VSPKDVKLDFRKDTGSKKKKKDRYAEKVHPVKISSSRQRKS